MTAITPNCNHVADQNRNLTVNQLVVKYPNLTVKGLMLLMGIPKARHDQAKRLLAAAKAWTGAPMERRLEGLRRIAAAQVGLEVQKVRTSKHFEKHVQRYTDVEMRKVPQLALLPERSAPHLRLDVRDHTTLLDGSMDVTVAPCALGKQLPDDSRDAFHCDHDGVMGEMIVASKAERKAIAA